MLCVLCLAFLLPFLVGLLVSIAFMLLFCLKQVCVLEGMIYAVGGVSYDSVSIAATHRYHPAANAWSTVSPMANARAGHGLFVLEQKMYACSAGELNSDASSEVEVYDPVTDTWAGVSPMKRSRSYFGACAAPLQMDLFEWLAQRQSQESQGTTPPSLNDDNDGDGGDDDDGDAAADGIGSRTRRGVRRRRHAAVEL